MRRGAESGVGLSLPSLRDTQARITANAVNAVIMPISAISSSGDISFLHPRSDKRLQDDRLRGWTN
jgi:hypothetical protein